MLLVKLKTVIKHLQMLKMKEIFIALLNILTLC